MPLSEALEQTTHKLCHQPPNHARPDVLWVEHVEMLPLCCLQHPADTSSVALLVEGRGQCLYARHVPDVRRILFVNLRAVPGTKRQLGLDQHLGGNHRVRGKPQSEEGRHQGLAEVGREDAYSGHCAGHRGRRVEFAGLVVCRGDDVEGGHQKGPQG
eukprot:CAMPEP_0173460464 /NCGR_PEP_ID=MMETSP1357-20121228/63208_1 /TAXON_ID=77926 /ORGANISM="Hemiselmis rufescens, Strain PCC563" /LENGTH=156 /DNA_ID=CAMNT_0014428033 /DNA_START=188 /DNA_END=654 /DNA_ORIENTATION=+